MGSRGGVLMRGIGVLVVVLAVIAILAARGPGRSRQVAQAIPTVTATRVPAATPTPAATSTPIPPHVTYLAQIDGAGVKDSATGTSAQLRNLLVRSSHGHVFLDLLIAVRAGGNRRAPYSAGNFYLIAADGSTYSPLGRPGRSPGLGSGAAPAHRSAAGWITFQLPPRAGVYQAIWNDANRYIPPGTLSTITVQRMLIP